MCWGSRAGSKDGHLSFRLERLGQASRGARQCRGWGQHTPLPAAPFWERAETCSVSRVDHDCFKQQLCHHEPNWQDLPWQGVWGTCGWTTSELGGHMGGAQLGLGAWPLQHFSEYAVPQLPSICKATLLAVSI